jgi:hypothetical protein
VAEGPKAVLLIDQGLGAGRDLLVELIDAFVTEPTKRTSGPENLPFVPGDMGHGTVPPTAMTNAVALLSHSAGAILGFHETAVPVRAIVLMRGISARPQENCIHRVFNRNFARLLSHGQYWPLKIRKSLSTHIGRLFTVAVLQPATAARWMLAGSSRSLRTCENATVFVTNHVLSGVLIGQVLGGRPVTAFLVGVGSHLVLDSIPHWSCDKSILGAEERFLKAARRDGVLGLATMAAASVAVDRKTRPATVAAMAGAAFLDLDKPILHFVGVNPFPVRIQRLHSAVQNESPAGMRNELSFGFACVVADAAVAVLSRRPRSAR